MSEDQALACGCTVIGGKVVNWCEIHRDTRGRDLIRAAKERIAELEAEVEELRKRPTIEQVRDVLFVNRRRFGRENPDTTAAVVCAALNTPSQQGGQDE